VQGEGGYLPASTAFMQGLRALCDEHGIVLIVDEVQSGIARCGKYFAIEHHGVEPDILTTAKGLGGGLVISGVVGKTEIMDAPVPGGLGGTYSGNPVAVATANAVLDVIEEENLLARATELGERMRSRFEAMQARFDCIAEVRGLGAMTAVEFCHGGKPESPAGDIAAALKNEAARRGLLLLNCGNYGNVLRVMIPLTIPFELLDEGLDIIETALAKVTAGEA
jgi:4-aminobutyrate aminotransferase-like enzyme